MARRVGPLVDSDGLPNTIKCKGALGTSSHGVKCEIYRLFVAVKELSKKLCSNRTKLQSNLTKYANH